MDKLFIAIWVWHENGKNHQSEAHPLDWFSDEKGYDQEDIARLTDLERHSSIHIGHGHYIIRIK